MSADNMPPLPVVAYSVTFQGKHCSNYCERLDEAWEQKRRRDAAFGENGREVVPLVTEADARAYAAEQTRELVEALQSAVDAWSGDGPPVVLDTLRALIAKHKGDA